MSTHKILMSGTASPSRLAFYRALTPPDFELVYVENPDDKDSLATTLKDVEFSYGSLLPNDWLDLAPNLKLIQFSGVGHVDSAVRAAQEHGVPVTITPEGTCLGVAEHTLLLMLALYKHLVEAHISLRNREWAHQRLRANSYFLYGKVLGIVGLGRIGLDVLQRVRGFEPAKIVYHDIFRKPLDEEKALGVEYMPLEDLLRVADIVTLHVFLSERSRGMIGERELSLMKPSAILINTSRGAVVDETALYHALRDRKIWGAGIDAWTEEPTPPDNPILQLDNVVCTPHMATGTVDADRMKWQAAIANFQRVLRDEAPVNVAKLYAQIEATANTAGS